MTNIELNVLTLIANGEVPCQKNTNLETQELGNILKDLKDNNFIKNVTFSKAGHKILCIFADNSHLTLKGLTTIPDNENCSKKLDTIYQVLKTLNLEEKYNYKEDYQLSTNQFGQILTLLKESRLVENVHFASSSSSISCIFDDNIRITMIGRKYLEECK